MTDVKKGLDKSPHAKMKRALKRYIYGVEQLPLLTTTKEIVSELEKRQGDLLELIAGLQASLDKVNTFTTSFANQGAANVKKK